MEEVLALIALLGKLIVMHLLEKKSAASLKQPSLPSGAIRANTSCIALAVLACRCSRIVKPAQLNIIYFSMAYICRRELRKSGISGNTFKEEIL